MWRPAGRAANSSSLEAIRRPGIAMDKNCMKAPGGSLLQRAEEVAEEALQDPLPHIRTARVSKRSSDFFRSLLHGGNPRVRVCMKVADTSPSVGQGIQLEDVSGDWRGEQAASCPAPSRPATQGSGPTSTIFTRTRTASFQGKNGLKRSLETHPQPAFTTQLV